MPNWKLLKKEEIPCREKGMQGLIFVAVRTLPFLKICQMGFNAIYAGKKGSEYISGAKYEKPDELLWLNVILSLVFFLAVSKMVYFNRFIPTTRKIERLLEISPKPIKLENEDNVANAEYENINDANEVAELGEAGL